MQHIVLEVGLALSLIAVAALISARAAFFGRAFVDTRGHGWLDHTRRILAHSTFA